MNWSILNIKCALEPNTHSASCRSQCLLKASSRAIASNTDKRTGGRFGDEFDDPFPAAPYDDNIDVSVQQLFDNSGSWRQARVPLAPFAGESNLSLKVEFATSGTTIAGTDSILAVAGQELVDGGSPTTHTAPASSERTELHAIRGTG